jgi:type I restriction enzyme S subunit
MTAQDLKNSILQLAMQGKLVPQDPNDEPASVLEKTFQKEREKLRRNSRCIPVPLKIEDFPFDIPESWIFIRFADLVRFSSGKTPGRNELKYWDSHEIPWVAISDMVHGKIISDTKEKISQKAMLDCFPNGICPKGTLIMSFKLTIGKISFLGMDAVHNEAIISIFPFVNEDNRNTLKQYLFHILPMICNSGDSKNAIMGRTLNSTSLSNLIIPLPPIAEQSRIVKKIEELLPLIERYDESEKRLLELNKKFPDELRKSILQQAVQGKLTEQDPHDEPASELLKRIKAEKVRLIKEGKIKKEKPLPPISEEEIPFDIPEGWVWIRLNSIAQKITDGTHHSPPNIQSGDYMYITAKNIKEYGVELHNVTYVTAEIHNEIFSRCNPEFGDLLLIKDGATAGVATVNNIHEPFSMLSSVALIKLCPSVLPEYVVWVLRSNLFYANLRANMKGAAITRVTLKQIEPMLLPLPPLAEQDRIVAKIKELLPLCDSLK